MATLCRVLRAEAAEASVVEPGVKALQEICELPELQDAAMEVVKTDGLSGVGKCPMTWEYWTSPYSSHLVDHIPNGWVM